MKAGALPSTVDFAPLDPDACKHDMRLIKAWHCAHPVSLNGKHAHIQGFSGGQHGGRVALDVYLTGDPTPHDSSLITIAETPKWTNSRSSSTWC